MPLKLLLADGDDEFARLLASRLQQMEHQVAIVADGRAALAEVRTGRFDAVIVDRTMPRLDGIAFLETVRGGGLTLPIVMLSAFGRSSDCIEGLEAGADDYAIKPIAAAELNARLKAILRGRQWTGVAADTVHAGDIVVAPASFRVWRAGRPIMLPKLEFALLAELARHADQVLTRAMLIERVWQCDIAPTTNIVDVHIRRLRIKLIEGGNTDPIVTMRGVGYMLRS